MVGRKESVYPGRWPGVGGGGGTLWPPAPEQAEQAHDSPGSSLRRAEARPQVGQWLLCLFPTPSVQDPSGSVPESQGFWVLVSIPPAKV